MRGEKMYIHCWGGHGRTGTLVATMLGRLYGLPYTSEWMRPAFPTTAFWEVDQATHTILPAHV
jgi:hypothetical protein